MKKVKQFNEIDKIFNIFSFSSMRNVFETYYRNNPTKNTKIKELLIVLFYNTTKNVWKISKYLPNI